MTGLTLEDVYRIAEIGSILGACGVVLFKVGRISGRVQETLNLQNVIMTRQADEISELKEETKKLGDVLKSLAVQDERINTLTKWYDELRRGEGFVFPLSARLKGG